ncbi:MAG: FKBP-type peptidyl-prolyl cis-trans isomerase [Bacteroidales bacterium]
MQAKFLTGRHPLFYRVLWIVLISLLPLMGVSGCQLFRVTDPEPDPEAEERTTESGLTYIIHRQGDGPRPSTGDLVTVHYTGMLADGTEFDSSHDREEPVSFRLSSGQVLPGWEEGILLLREGAEATFIIPPELAYGDMGFGPVPENETLKFDLELLEVIPPAEPLEAEREDRTELTEGIHYFIVEEGEGPGLEEDMQVSLHYTGYLDDEGTVFDSSYDRDEPLSFVLGSGVVIPGWEKALPEFRVGDKIRLWVPYQLAYGEQGRDPIPGSTDLVFDIEILEAEDIDEPQPFDVEGLDTLHTTSGLQYIVVEEGHGERPEKGHVLVVHYSAYLSDGTLFDSSVKRGEPLRFVLGAGQVLEGLDIGFSLLKKGSKARLIIPPYLAYGDEGEGPVPPDETVIFDVELIDFQR